jgi:hypothetical protein
MLKLIIDLMLAQVAIEVLGALLLVLIAVCNSWKKAGY